MAGNFWGADTPAAGGGGGSFWDGSPAANSVADTSTTPLSTLGRLAGVATSGQKFLSAVTGGRLDISGLPGIIEKPLDILASPVGLASLGAAAFTGGASLLGEGAIEGVAGRLAGQAVTDVGGGLVGGEAAKATAGILPQNSPDWLKVAAPTVAGLVAGGVTGSTIAKRLPGALSNAGQTIAKAGPDLALTDAEGNPVPNWLGLKTAMPGLTKVQQVKSIVNDLVAKNVFGKQDPQITPVLDQVDSGEQIAKSMATASYHVVAKISKELDLDKQNRILVGPREVDNPNLPVAQDGLVLGPESARRIPIQDVAAKLPLYADRLSPDQLDAIQRLGAEFSGWKSYANAVGRNIETRGDVMEGGVYIPRGEPGEDGTADFVIPSATGPRLGGKAGAEKASTFTSMEQGLAAGTEYPSLAQATYDYVNGVGKAIVGQHAANQLKNVVDPEGNPVFSPYSPSEGMPKGQVAVPGLPGLSGEPQYAAAVANRLKPNDPWTKITEGMGAVNAPFRAAHVMLDLAFNTRTGPIAFIQNPKQYIEGLTAAYSSLKDPTVIGKLYDGITTRAIAEQAPTIQDMIRSGLVLSGRQNEMQSTFVKSIPVVGNALSKVSDMYGAFTDSVRPLMAEAAIRNARASGHDLSDPAVLSGVMASVNHATGAGTGGTPKGADAFIQFPNWLQSQFQVLGDAITKGGYQGNAARDALLKLIGVGTAVTVGVNTAQGRKTTYAGGDTGTIGIGPVKVGVPVMQVGDQKINVFGPYGSLIAGMIAAGNGDIGYLLRSKASPLVGMGWDIATGQKFDGSPARADDPAYWAQQAAPFNVADLGSNTSVTSQALTTLGVHASDISNTQARNNLVNQMFGKDYADLTGLERQKLQQANPDLYQSIHEDTVTRASAGDKAAQGILATQAQTDGMLQKQQQLAGMLQSGQISPQMFREAIDSATHDAAIAKGQIRKDFSLDANQKTPTPVQDALNQYYALYDKADLGVQSGGKPTGQINWDDFDQMSADLMSRLSPEQQKAITDRVTPHDPSIQWFVDNKNLINQSGYYATTNAAFAKNLTSIQRIAPDAASLSDLQQAQSKALAEGDRGMYLYTTSLINRVQSSANALKQVMLLKNPALKQALIQNGYISQPRGQALVARP